MGCTGRVLWTVLWAVGIYPFYWLSRWKFQREHELVVRDPPPPLPLSQLQTALPPSVHCECLSVSPPHAFQVVESRPWLIYEGATVLYWVAAAYCGGWKVCLTNARTEQGGAGEGPSQASKSSQVVLIALRLVARTAGVAVFAAGVRFLPRRQSDYVCLIRVCIPHARARARSPGMPLARACRMHRLVPL